MNIKNVNLTTNISHSTSMSNDFLSKDLICEVVKHLNPCDVYEFSFVNKFVHGTISMQTIIIERLNIKMKDILGDAWDKVKLELEKVGGVISGSIIIQTILGENWETDVDIMLDNTKLTHTQIKHKQISNFDDFLYQTLDLKWANYDSMHTYERGQEEIVSVRCYDLKTCKTKVQTVIFKVEDKTMDQFVFSHSDFDICRNVYGIKDGIEYVKVCSMDQIVNRRTRFALGKHVSNSMGRHHKYVSRGFTFTNDVKDAFEQIVTDPTMDYKVFYVQKIKNATRKFKLIKGNMEEITSTIPISIIDHNTLDFTQNACVACNQDVACPVKFCFGDEIPVYEEFPSLLNLKTLSIQKKPGVPKSHFHILVGYEWYGDRNFIFIEVS